MRRCFTDRLDAFNPSGCNVTWRIQIQLTQEVTQLPVRAPHSSHTDSVFPLTTVEDWNLILLTKFVVSLIGTSNRYVNPSLLFPTRLYGPQGKSLCLIYHFNSHKHWHIGGIQKFSWMGEWNSFLAWMDGEKAWPKLVSLSFTSFIQQIVFEPVLGERHLLGLGNREPGPTLTKPGFKWGAVAGAEIKQRASSITV